MVALVVLLGLLSVYSHAAFPTFDDDFYGAFVRNNTLYEGSSALSDFSVIVSVSHKRAYVSVTPRDQSPSNLMLDQAGDFLLVYSPKGAEAGTIHSSSYVIFQHVLAGDQSYCSYSTVPLWSGTSIEPPGIFPAHWVTSTGSIEMLNWFLFPSDMAFVEVSELRGIDVEEWVSNKECTPFGSTIPCNYLAVTEGSSTPIATQTAHEKSPFSFESNWISYDYWTDYGSTNVPHVTPPQDWTSQCSNSENGLSIFPQRAFVSTPAGMDSFTVSLQTNGRPVKSMGSVTVRIQVATSPATVEFVLDNGATANSIEFTHDNWNVPVTVHLKYLTPGTTQFQLVASGGSYSIPYILSKFQRVASVDVRSATLIAYACEKGVVGNGCS